MSRFLQSLVLAGKVPFLVDYRTGSAQSLSGMVAGTNPTVTNTPRFQHTSRGMAADFRSGYLTYPHQADQILTEFTSLALGNPIYASSASAISGRVISKRDGASSSFEMYIRPNVGSCSLGITVGGVLNAVNYTQSGNGSLACTAANGGYPSFFKNGVLIGAGANIATFNSTTPNLYVGNYAFGTLACEIPISAIIIINEALSPADIARLHRELVDAPAVVSRARKAFSIPYPVKTAAEYAAEGIILDLAPKVVGGKMRDMSGNGYDATITGQADASGSPGPFTEETTLLAGSYGTFPAAFGAVIFDRTYTVEAWVRPKSISAGAGVLLGSASIPYVGRISAAMFSSYRDSALVQKTHASSNCIVANKISHLVYTFKADGATITVGKYCDGIDVGSITSLTGLSPSGSVALLNIFAVGSPSPFQAGYEGLRYYDNRVLTPAEIREEYLKGARKCLLDARVHSDGSCPVSLTAVGPGSSIANGWTVQSGTWKVVEDAPTAPGVAGKRWLSNTAGTPGVCSQFDGNSNYGSWYVRTIPGAGGTIYVSLNSSVSGSWNAANQNGYWLAFTNRTVQLAKTVGGAWTVFLYSPITIEQDLEFWVTRSFNGSFNIWVRGGTYGSDWTVPPLQLGTLPFTDTSFSQPNGYVNVQANSFSSKCSGAQHFLGAMSPYEAIRLGLIEGTIPEPLVFTTTKLTQSWQLNLTAGSVYVFDWGDGTSDWYTGTGALQTLTHTYASAGTYTIKLHIANPLALTDFRCTSNQLSGTLPSFAACTNLVTFYCHANSFSGTLPSFAACTNLANFYCYANSFSGTLPSFAACTNLANFYCYSNNFSDYTPGVMPTPCNNYRADMNLLPTSAVDAILADFETNVAARPATGTINLTANAAPSAAGLASKAAILAVRPLWVITHN
ncbi:MAG: LamG-like jellyroll fold domain-containing protein [Parcubacteria group bacterium]